MLSCFNALISQKVVYRKGFINFKQKHGVARYPARLGRGYAVWHLLDEEALLYPLFYLVVDFPNETKHYYVTEKQGKLRPCSEDFVCKPHGRHYFQYRVPLTEDP
jgi:hypothetical protein